MDSTDWQADVATAHAVAAAAAAKRKSLRRRTRPGNPTREEQLAKLIDDITDAMAPLRSLAGKFVWINTDEEMEARVRSASKALQYERKQIRKMQRR